MRMTSHTTTVGELFDRRDRLVVPDIQRDYVWDPPHRHGVIASVLEGVRLPLFYIAKSNDGLGKDEIIDGQQRLTTFFRLLSGEASLPPATVKYLGLDPNKVHRLPYAFIETIRNVPVDYDLLIDATQEDKADYFRRLQNGMRLTARDLANSLFGGMRDFAKELSLHAFFKSGATLGSKSGDDKFGDAADVTNRTVAIAVTGLSEGVNLKQIEALFEKNERFSPQSALAVHLLTTFDFLAEAFSTKTKELHERLYVQSVAVLASRLVAGGADAHHAAPFASFVRSFFNTANARGRPDDPGADPDYLRFSNVVRRNLPRGPAIQHEILVKKMDEDGPVLAGLLAPYDGIHSWAPAAEISSFPEASLPMRVTMTPQTGRTVRKLIEMLESGELTVPDWQRKPVWNTRRQEGYINTVLKTDGWTSPKLIIAQNPDGPGLMVIDGLQRLTTLINFWKGLLRLSPGTMAEHGISVGHYSQLPEQLANQFCAYPLRVDLIEGATDKQLREIFRRFQMGVALKNKELLNATPGNLRDYIKNEVATHRFFSEGTALPATRNGYLDVGARIVATEIEGLHSHPRYYGLKKLFEKERNFAASTSPVALHIQTTLDFLARAFPTRGGELRQAEMVLATFNLASQLVVKGRSVGMETDFAQFIRAFIVGFREHNQRLRDGLPITDLAYKDFGMQAKGDVRGLPAINNAIMHQKMSELAPLLALAFVLPPLPSSEPARSLPPPPIPTPPAPLPEPPVPAPAPPLDDLRKRLDALRMTQGAAEAALARMNILTDRQFAHDYGNKFALAENSALDVLGRLATGEIAMPEVKGSIRLRLSGDAVSFAVFVGLKAENLFAAEYERVLASHPAPPKGARPSRPRNGRSLSGFIVAKKIISHAPTVPASPQKPVSRVKVHGLSPAAGQLTRRTKETAPRLLADEPYASQNLRPLLDALAQLGPPVVNYLQLSKLLTKAGAALSIADARRILNGQIMAVIPDRPTGTNKLNPVVLPLVAACGKPSHVIFANLLEGRNVTLRKMSEGTADPAAPALTWEAFAGVCKTLAQKFEEYASRPGNAHQAGIDGIIGLLRPEWSDAASARRQLGEVVAASHPYDEDTGRLKPVMASIIWKLAPNAAATSLFPEFKETLSKISKDVGKRRWAFAALVGSIFVAGGGSQADVPSEIGSNGEIMASTKEFKVFLYGLVQPASMVHSKKHAVVAIYLSVITGRKTPTVNGKATTEARELRKALDHFIQKNAKIEQPAKDRFAKALDSFIPPNPETGSSRPKTPSRPPEPSEPSDVVQLEIA